jgi:acetyl-CoA carboxylase carboxyl transferase subunit alpha
LKITSNELKELELIDDVIDEPLIGGHRNKDEAVNALGTYFLQQVEELTKLTSEQRYEQRYAKLMALGSFS